jgi:hypothetical protein
MRTLLLIFLTFVSLSSFGQIQWDRLGFKVTAGTGTTSFGFHYHDGIQLSGGFVQNQNLTGGYLQGGYRFNSHEDALIVEDIWVSPEARIDYLQSPGKVDRSLNTDFVLTAGGNLFGLEWMVPSASLLFGKNWFESGLSLRGMVGVTVVFGAIGS